MKSFGGGFGVGRRWLWLPSIEDYDSDFNFCISNLKAIVE